MSQESPSNRHYDWMVANQARVAEYPGKWIGVTAESGVVVAGTALEVRDALATRGILRDSYMALVPPIRACALETR